MRKEQSVDKTIEEINKHRTVLDKMKVVINQPEKKQFDSKFTVNFNLKNCFQMLSKNREMHYFNQTISFYLSIKCLNYLQLNAQ